MLCIQQYLSSERLATSSNRTSKTKQEATLLKSFMSTGDVCTYVVVVPRLSAFFDKTAAALLLHPPKEKVGKLKLFESSEVAISENLV